MKKPPVDADAFKRRLVLAMEVAALTIADLQHWFEREYVTVYSWVHHGKIPRPGFRTDELMLRMRLLESAISDGIDGFPMPSSLSQFKRADHVRKVFLDACKRRSARRAVR